MKTRAFWFALVAVGTALWGCHRDEGVDSDPPAQVLDERDLFVGTYRIYDALGIYMYDMSISKFGSNGRDSLLIQNYADTFDIRVLHERYWTNKCLRVFSNPAIDQAGNSWALFAEPCITGSNVISGDTIPLKFTMDNIAFYWTEGVPYFSCVCKQIAVKQ